MVVGRVGIGRFAGSNVVALRFDALLTQCDARLQSATFMPSTSCFLLGLGFAFYCYPTSSFRVPFSCIGAVRHFIYTGEVCSSFSCVLALQLVICGVGGFGCMGGWTDSVGVALQGGPL